jgi:hypothetical protein
MALEVEDGTGKANAESYISVADADLRHTAFGNAAWTGTDAVKEAALRRATAYMEQAYRERWQGVRRHVDQALSWPRWNVCVDSYYLDTESVPADVANACADLALRALTGDLNADLAREVVREKVGPLETEYAPHSPQATQFRAVDMALAPYLNGGGVNARLVRA